MSGMEAPDGAVDQEYLDWLAQQPKERDLREATAETKAYQGRLDDETDEDRRLSSMMPPPKKPQKKQSPSKTSSSSDLPPLTSSPAPNSTSRKRKATPRSSLGKEAVKRPRVGKTLTQPPSEILDIWIFGKDDGTGVSGPRRPVPSPYFPQDNYEDIPIPKRSRELNADFKVVQVAVGKAHCVALTADNRILTWGSNNFGALGRETQRHQEVQPTLEAATPTAIDTDLLGGESTIFTQVAATNHASFALTQDGYVYGWGTFLATEGILGFSPDVPVALEPVHIPQLKSVVKLAPGDNHVLALSSQGNVFVWGAGSHSQLGRRVVERTKRSCLAPRELGGLPRNKITTIATGAVWAFAKPGSGKFKDKWHAWGDNIYGQAGIDHDRGEENDGFVVQQPIISKMLSGLDLVQIEAGSHHSLGRTSDGKVVFWGRCDGYQSGFTQEQLMSEDVGALPDETGRPKTLNTPTVIPDLEAESIAVGFSTNFVLTPQGEVYSWGYGENYRTGHGTEADVEVPTKIGGPLEGKKVVFVAAGDGFGIIGCATA